MVNYVPWLNNVTLPVSKERSNREYKASLKEEVMISTRQVFFFSIMLISTALFLLEGVVAQTTPSDFNTIFEQNKSAVVLISTYTLDGTLLSQGSGFIVRPDGYIITNYHVIIGACSVLVKLDDGRTFSVESVTVHRTNDVALLKVNAQNLHAVRLGDTQRINREDLVLVISNPGGLQNIPSKGKVIREIRGTTFEIDAAVSHGSSGGPVFNANGFVVGFIVAGIENSLRNTAIAANEASVLLASALSRPETVRSLSELCSSNCETAEHYYDLGIAATSKGRFDDALQNLNIVLQMCPTYADAHIRIAMVHQELGFYQLAVLGYTIAIENGYHLRDKSVLPSLYFNRGISYLRINICDKAAADFRKVLEMPDQRLHSKANYNLYVACYNCEQYDQAISNFYKAWQREPELISPCDWTSVGYCYLELHQLDSAETVLNRSIKLGCTEAKTWQYVSQVHLLRKDTVGAIEVVKDGIKYYSENAELWFQLGNLDFELKKYQDAIEAYKVVLRIQPNNESARYNRCACHLNLAVQYIEQNQISLCLGELEKAAECDTLKEKIADIKFDVYSHIGIEQLKNDNPRAAIDTLKLAINIKRTVCNVWYILGIAYSKVQDNTNALIALAQAIEVGRDSCQCLAYLQRGIIHRRINEHLKAIDDFKKALACGLQESVEQICWTFASMGEDHLQNKRFREAIELADSALRYDARCTSAYFLRGRAWIQLKEHWKALADLEKVLSVDPSLKRAFCVIAQACYNIGATNFDLGRYRAAEDTLKLALNKLSGCGEPQFHKELARGVWSTLAKVYMETARYKEAVDAFSRAIEVDPEYPPSWCGRGEARYRLKQFVDAREDLQHAIGLNRDYARAYGLLLECRLELKDFDGACVACGHLERLHVDDANNPCRARIQGRFGKMCP